MLFIAQVALKHLFGQFICAGVIYDDTHVITNTFCCNQITENLDIVAGDHDLNFAEPSQQTFYAKRILPHEDYDPATRINDICLIKIDGVFQFNK